MSTPEYNVGKSVDAAEARINRNQTDITTSPVDKKAEIKRMETSIKKALDGYKQMGIYSGVIENFKDVQTSDDHTPEFLMMNMAFRFDRMAASESAQAGMDLNVLAAKTYNDLRTLKTDLESAGGSEIRLEARVEEQYQRMLPEASFDPSNISETSKRMGELLGQQPNVGRLEGYEVENDMMLSELRLSKNAAKYSAASLEFRYLTGISLEGVKQQAGKALEAAYKKAQEKGVEEAKGDFFRAFAAAQDLFKITNDVISRALFSEHTDTATEDSEHAVEGHGDYLSDAEMQMLLSVIMNGVEDKSYFEQLFDAKTALDFYAGRQVDLNTLNPVERQAFALVNGMGKGAAATVGFFAHPWEALTHIAAAGKALFKASTYKKIAQMTSYTWENTSALEKNMLLGDMVGQLLGGAGIGNGLSMLLKSSALGAAGTKLAGVARLTGMASSAEVIASAVNPLLRTMPGLAKYGTRASEIVKTLVDDGTALAHKWDHFIHKAHEVHSAIDYAETATINTAGVAHDAHDAAEKEGLPKNLPVYAETKTLLEDMKVAEANSGKLGMTSDEVYRLQSAARLLREVQV